MNPGRKALVAAAIAAAGVLAVLLIEDVVLTVLNLVSSASLTGQGATYFGAIIDGSWIQMLTTSLPLTVGVFLALWRIAPIDRDLRLVNVLTRSMFAAGLGAVAVLVVGATIGVSLAIPGRFDFAYLVGLGGRPFGDIIAAVFGALQTALVTFVSGVPLVALAGVLLWLWSRESDRSHRVEGMLDL